MICKRSTPQEIEGFLHGLVLSIYSQFCKEQRGSRTWWAGYETIDALMESVKYVRAEAGLDG